MSRPQVLASVLSLAIGLFPLAAPEHVHEREDHGHELVVVHRHMAPHGLDDHADRPDDHADHRDDDGHQTSWEDDAPVLTLTTVYTVPASVVLAAPERSTGDLIEAPERESVERVLTKFDVPIHGPPRAPSLLRGPPFSPAS